METVTRKSLLYKSGLGFFCVNHVQGCAHGCLYPCYAEKKVHGISLVSLDEDFRRRWEPGAAPYADRVAAIEALHEAGRTTLVHIEPCPPPNILRQDLTRLLEAVSFVDHVFFGGWNYSKLVRRDPATLEFYRAAAAAVRRFCRERGITCETGEA